MSTLEQLRGSLVTIDLALGVGASLLSESSDPILNHPVVAATISSLAAIKNGTSQTGQFSQIINTQALATAAQSAVKETLPVLENHALPGEKRKRMHTESTLMNEVTASTVTPQVKASAVASVLAGSLNEDVFSIFYSALNELRSHHHSNPTAAQSETLEDAIVFALQKPTSAQDKRLNRFSEDEVCGKFVDFNTVMDKNRAVIGQVLDIKDTPKFCQWLLDASNSASSKGMLLEGDFKTKKKLVGVIGDVVEYLTDYKNRVQPLMSLKEIVDPALMGTVWQTVNEEWCPSDAADIDLSTIKSKADLEPFDLTTLTTALTSRGMKAGGTKVQKIDRLMHAVGVKDLSSIPAKHMAKASAATSADNASALFVLDFQCTALLKHYRPTLLQSVERNKRRRGQTVAEKLHERNEILTGTALEITEEESDEEEEIYNPKNLPLGWDGKPIAVWLYKLHGLNKYYHCEICGDETYRGQRDYEKHFGENKHSYGMKCLGIPNSKHFHGITKVDDARALWKKIQGEDLLHPGSAAVGGGGDSSGEQFEDRDGNVMSKEAYEGLARQGLL